jgi:hypothetical protein
MTFPYICGCIAGYSLAFMDPSGLLPSLGFATGIVLSGYGQKKYTTWFTFGLGVGTWTFLFLDLIQAPRYEIYKISSGYYIAAPVKS